MIRPDSQKTSIKDEVNRYIFNHLNGVITCLNDGVITVNDNNIVTKVVYEIEVNVDKSLFNLSIELFSDKISIIPLIYNIDLEEITPLFTQINKGIIPLKQSLLNFHKNILKYNG